MRRISSGSTFFHKRVFPVIWFGGLFYLVLSALNEGALRDEPLRVYGVGLVGVGMFFLMKLSVWRFADAVYDCGDHLLFRTGAKEAAVYLRDIQTLGQDVNPPRIRLVVQTQGGGPSEMSFEPSGGFSLSANGQRRVFEDLAKRVEQAQARGVA
jgi:hypothetical protein